MFKGVYCGVALVLWCSLSFAPARAAAHHDEKKPQQTDVMPVSRLGEKTTLTGTVQQRSLHLPAMVIVRDQTGQRRQAETDERGVYRLDVGGLSAPLRLLAVESGGKNCLASNIPRAVCLSALVPSAQSGRENTAHVNPLTDRIASDVAVAAGYSGPQQLIDDKSAPKLSAAAWKKAYAAFHAGFDPALRQAGLDAPAKLDPLRYSADQASAVQRIVGILNHNRGYDSGRGQAGPAILTDGAFRPIAGPLVKENYQPLDYRHASRQLEDLEKAPRRIFIIGDASAANVEKIRAPRAGWGETFEKQFRVDSGVRVVNGAREGTSSRSYFYEGWLRQMQPLMKAGDYLFIQLGYDDLDCNAARATRGAADVANLCTYPNDADGERQFPPGKPDMSLQSVLEQYIAFARQRQLIPVLLTPTARAETADGKAGTPAAARHLTRQNAETSYVFVGDYRRTLADTARANSVPLLDIETATLALANGGNGKQWQKYWLAVSPSRYPYYRNREGSLRRPDPAHLQQRGAAAVARLVADAIRQTPELAPLAAGLADGKKN